MFFVACYYLNREDHEIKNDMKMNKINRYYYHEIAYKLIGSMKQIKTNEKKKIQNTGVLKNLIINFMFCLADRILQSLSLFISDLLFTNPLLKSFYIRIEIKIRNILGVLLFLLSQIINRFQRF